MWDVAELDGEVMSVTLDTGERVYCGVADAAAESSGRGSAGGAGDRAGGQHSGRLLARPITELLRQAEDAAVARAMLASEKEATPTPASAPDPGDARFLITTADQDVRSLCCFESLTVMASLGMRSGRQEAGLRSRNGSSDHVREYH